MLNKQQAFTAFKKAYPDRAVQVSVFWNNLYILRAITADPAEGMFDPFFSVNANTGEVKEFSIITDGNADKLTALFKIADGGK